MDGRSTKPTWFCRTAKNSSSSTSTKPVARVFDGVSKNTMPLTKSVTGQNQNWPPNRSSIRRLPINMPQRKRFAKRSERSFLIDTFHFALSEILGHGRFRSTTTYWKAQATPSINWSSGSRDLMNTSLGVVTGTFIFRNTSWSTNRDDRSLTLLAARKTCHKTSKPSAKTSGSTRLSCHT